MGWLIFVNEGFASSKYKFDSSMLGEKGDGINFDLFNEGLQLPGIYSVDVLLNGEKVDHQEIDFIVKRENDGVSLYPCMSVEILTSYNIRTEDFSDLDDGTSCANLTAIPGASYDFSYNEQQLRLSVPQIYMRPSSAGLAPEILWDDGLNIFRMNYSGTFSRNEYKSVGGNSSSDSAYMQFSPGVNLGAWRLRNISNWRKDGGLSDKWEYVSTYAEKGIHSLKSRFTVGETSSQDPVFDSIPFTGFMLTSDDNMVPFIQRSYSPIVRGIAKSQSRVQIQQDGYTIFETSVAPGPFALRDFNAGSVRSGDLEVTIFESDGSIQKFTVPNQAPALAVKEGHLNYTLLTGKYRSSKNLDSEPWVSQGSILYGLPYDLTIYSGVQGAQDYLAGSLGFGVSLGYLGATSLDVIRSRAQLLNENTREGSAWRMRYSKIFTTTDTVFSMAGYRYASPDFYTIADMSNEQRMQDSVYQDNKPLYKNQRMRSATNVSVSQRVKSLGSISFNYANKNYWNSNNSDQNYGLSYGMSLPWNISLSVNQVYNRRKMASGKDSKDSITNVWLSMPLGSMNDRFGTLSYQGTNANAGSSNSIGLSGTGFDNKLNVDFRQSNERSSSNLSSNSSFLHAAWQGAYGTLGAYYSQSSQNRALSTNLSGGMVIHEDGLTIGQPLNNTVALIKAERASGAKVHSSAGVKTDFRGYALLSSLSPYVENNISIEPLGVNPDVEILQTDVKVIPTSGAVVAARFKTRPGGKALMRMLQSNNIPVPFGSVVTVNKDSDSAGIVGSNGEVYLTGLPNKGTLFVRWKDDQCTISYDLTSSNVNYGVHNLDGICTK